VSRLATNPREPLETLKTYPAFQVLRAKAEQHQLQSRPKETERLEQPEGQLGRQLEPERSGWDRTPEHPGRSGQDDERERLDCEEQSPLDLPR